MTIKIFLKKLQPGSKKLTLRKIKKLQPGSNIDFEKILILNFIGTVKKWLTVTREDDKISGPIT